MFIMIVNVRICATTLNFMSIEHEHEHSVNQVNWERYHLYNIHTYENRSIKNRFLVMLLISDISLSFSFIINLIALNWSNYGRDNFINKFNKSAKQV